VLVSTQVAHRKFGAAKMMRKVYLQRAALLACGAAALAAVLVPACDAASTKVTKAWCHTMHKRHRVKPHVNWGTMMDERSQEKWMALLCDNELVEASKLGGSEVATDETPALNQDITWCESTQSSHNVAPGTTWGTLSAAGQETWRNKACDAILPKPTRPAKSRDMTTCTGDWASAPMIAICFGSTTRGVVNPGPETMTLFRYLLPSVQETAECGFQYGIFIGYDVGDKYWDNPQTRDVVAKWIDDNVVAPLAKLNIKVTLHLVSLLNKIKKPGPVFTAVTKAAYDAGALYFYRINDDTEFLENRWSSSFVKELLSLGKPYGVIGPFNGNLVTGQSGNNGILVHDFTHRLHMEIFEQIYYPVELVDWWMDDWITFVYGKKRTRQGRRHYVNHHVNAHGQRYQVAMANGQKLKGLVDKGARIIAKWMDDNGIEGGAGLISDDRSYIGALPQF